MQLVYAVCDDVLGDAQLVREARLLRVIVRQKFMQRRIDLMFRRAKAVLVLGRVWAEMVMNRLPEIASQVAILPNATGAGRKRSSMDRMDSVAVSLHIAE